jgi:hypothetical protein
MPGIVWPECQRDIFIYLYMWWKLINMDCVARMSKMITYRLHHPNLDPKKRTSNSALYTAWDQLINKGKSKRAEAMKTATKPVCKVGSISHTLRTDGAMNRVWWPDGPNILYCDLLMGESGLHSTTVCSWDRDITLSYWNTRSMQCTSASFTCFCVVPLCLVRDNTSLLCIPRLIGSHAFVDVWC